MRILMPILALVVLAGFGCSDSGEGDVVASFDAAVAPDESCRNNAVAESEDGRWLVMDDLPMEWRGRDKVQGVVEADGNGGFSFVAEGIRLAATDNMISPPLCTPWQAPTQASDG